MRSASKHAPPGNTQSVLQGGVSAWVLLLSTTLWDRFMTVTALVVVTLVFWPMSSHASSIEIAYGKIEALHYKRLDCTDFSVEHEIQVDVTTVIAITLCDRAAYNRVSVAYLIRGKSKVSVSPIDFPSHAAGDGNKDNYRLFNSVYAPQRGEVSSRYLLRGAGDCGEFQIWRLRGDTFELAEERRQPNCTGSTEPWPVVSQKP